MGGATFWEIFIPVAVLVFVLPTIVALVRGGDNIVVVILFNIFALVSFGVGWIAAMGFALIGKREPTRTGPRQVRRPVRQVRLPDHGAESLRGTPFESLAGQVSSGRLHK